MCGACGLVCAFSSSPSSERDDGMPRFVELHGKLQAEMSGFLACRDIFSKGDRMTAAAAALLKSGVDVTA